MVPPERFELSSRRLKVWYSTVELRRIELPPFLFILSSHCPGGSVRTRTLVLPVYSRGPRPACHSQKKSRRGFRPGRLLGIFGIGYRVAALPSGFQACSMDFALYEQAWIWLRRTNVSSPPTVIGAGFEVVCANCLIALVAGTRV